MKANRLRATIALLIAATFTLTACSSGGDPDATDGGGIASSSAAGNASGGTSGGTEAEGDASADGETPSPSTAPPATVSNPFPLCAEIWPPEDVAAMAPDFGAEAIVSSDPQAMIEFAPGPVAKNTLAQATKVQECMWGVPNSDSLVILWMAQVPVDARETFIDGLDESVYERSTHEDIVLYSLDRTQEVSPGCIDCSYYTWYGFIDELVIMAFPANDDVPGLFTLLREAMR